MARFAHERAVPVLDLSRGVGADPDGWFLPGDTVHPSPEGHSDLARRLDPLVRDLLEPRLAALRGGPAALQQRSGG
jgi:hypothetical protein